MFSRREFLKHAALLSLAPTVPGFLARTARAVRPERDRRVLVVVQLDGGNDGLNTVVPFADPAYARLRPTLKIARDQLHRIDDRVGLHPALADAAKLLEQGRFAAVTGVGYPNPSRSHFRSMAVWHSARLDPEDHSGPGWLGRALDRSARPESGAPDSLLVGPQGLPGALRGRKSVAGTLDRPEDFTPSATLPPFREDTESAGDDLAAFVRRSTLDAYATADRLNVVLAAPGGDAYPGSELGQRLRLVARLLKADVASRVFYVIQPGYDTHAGQARLHYDLLRDLGQALRAFQDDLAAARLVDRVLLLAFSEFGRQVRENSSAGTDHGTAGPVLLAGPAVRPGLHGALPSLTDLEGGEPRATVDFRRVYATVLEDWFGVPASSALAGSFAKLSLFR